MIYEIYENELADKTNITLRPLKCNKNNAFKFFHNICWFIGKGKDLTNVEKQEIAKLLREGMYIFGIPNELRRYHRTRKRTVENIS